MNDPLQSSLADAEISSRQTVRRRQPKARRRRGSLYVTVMGVTLIVGMIGVSILTVARLNRRAATAQHDAIEADLLATSAIDAAVAVLDSNENWRTDFLNDTEYPNPATAMGNGSLTWKLVDEDGDLADDDADDVRVFGIGRVGQTVRVHSATDT